MPDKKSTSSRGPIDSAVAKTLSATKLKTSIKSVDQSIVDELAKAFGNEVAYHIKESGPTWVNSPHHVETADAAEIVDRTVQITVHNAKGGGG